MLHLLCIYAWYEYVGFWKSLILILISLVVISETLDLTTKTVSNVLGLLFLAITIIALFHTYFWFISLLVIIILGVGKILSSPKYEFIAQYMRKQRLRLK